MWRFVTSSESLPWLVLYPSGSGPSAHLLHNLQNGYQTTGLDPSSDQILRRIHLGHGNSLCCTAITLEPIEPQIWQCNRQHNQQLRRHGNFEKTSQEHDEGRTLQRQDKTTRKDNQQLAPQAVTILPRQKHDAGQRALLNEKKQMKGTME
jgi:hypothetical protein